MGFTKLSIKKFLKIEELENFFNNFSKNNKIINKEIKIIPIKNLFIYFLILEY
jgi:hypothetical protein